MQHIAVCASYRSGRKLGTVGTRIRGVARRIVDSIDLLITHTLLDEQITIGHSSTVLLA